VKVRIIPTIPKVAIPAPIERPEILKPQGVTVTAETAAYYAEACEAFRSVGQEDSYDLDEVQLQYPGLTRSNSCEWSIYGLTVQGQLTFESQLNVLANYADNLRARIVYLESIIADIQAAATKQQEAVEDIGKD